MSARGLGLLVATTVGLVLTALGGPSSAHAAKHPYILWTREEAAALRHRIQTDPDAKRQYEKMAAERGNEWLKNLFRYAVMGDQKAGEAEHKYLCHFIGTHPDRGPVTRAHYDCYHDVLRYDVLYDRLTPEERKGVEETFRAYIAHQLKDRKNYTRTSWLPNMQWPRPLAAHLMAVGLGDEQLVKALIHSNGGWKWYFDEYIADGCFYMEEFGKHYSMIGEMLLFCRGLQRLGLDAWGYGYTGAGGATMRNYVASILMCGYPRIDLGSDRPHYPKVTMGDGPGAPKTLQPPGPPRDLDAPDEHASLRTGYWHMLQHDIVTGYLANGLGGNAYWIACNMNGRDHKDIKVPKMLEPLWFEIAHAEWPDAGFDYFLAQMRAPDEDKYYSTLYFGLGPVDPAKVKAPAAPSFVAPERGLVMLRADESSGYWESEAPAVALNLTRYYVHFVRDYLSLLGFYAFNRPIYVNRGISRGYATGDPWTGWGMGKCTVIVDRRLMADRPEGEPMVRHAFHPLAKFVAARTADRWPPQGVAETHDTGRTSENPSGIEPTDGPVDETRALVLTREYLLDVFRLRSPTPHVYDWQVHALGAHRPEDPKAWQRTRELDGNRLYSRTSDRLSLRHDLYDTHKMAPGKAPWRFRAFQACAPDDAAKSVLTPGWYSKGVGVRVTMLGGEQTVVYVGKTPHDDEPDNWREPEIGGVSLIARRRAPNATFVALHEPFKGDRPLIDAFERIAEDARSIAVRITGSDASPVEDRVMIALGDGPASLRTVTGGDEAFTFAGYAFVRAASDRIDVYGDLSAMKIRVKGKPVLFVNGEEVAAAVADGLLIFGP